MKLLFSLLGGFGCRTGDGAAIAFQTRKVRALAAYLATHAGHPQSRDRLARLLWDDGTDAAARANLRKALSRLRQALPEPARPCLCLEGDLVAFRPEGIEVDVLQITALVAAGTSDSFEHAIGLHGGDFLEGFAQCGEPFEEWMMAERRRYAEMHHTALRRLLDHHILTGSVEGAIQLALRLCALDPLQESAHQTLIQLYLNQGRTGPALDQYDACRDVLARELGVEPSAETERLKAAILRKGSGSEAEPAVAGNDLATNSGRSRLPNDPTGRPSIAVRPFVVVEGDDHNYLGAALADDIASELSHFSELNIIPLAGTWTHPRIGDTASEPAAASGATYVVGGRLRQAGNELRITAHLVETQTARQIWSERFERPARQVLQVEDEITTSIAASLLGQIIATSTDRARQKSPTNWRAYDYYSMGLSKAYGKNSASLGEAIQLFRKAIEADPQFARAYSWLAACYSRNAVFAVKGDAEAYRCVRSLVLDTVQKAISLDDTDAVALAVLGWNHIWNRDFANVEQIFERACRLRPCDGDLAMSYVTALTHLGEPEKAICLAEATIRRELRHPSFYLGDLATANFFARHNDRAVALLDDLPDDKIGENRAAAVAAYAHAGRLEEARGHAKRYLDELHDAWRGDPSASEFDYLTWERHYRFAYRRPEDIDYLCDGLRKAGLMLTL
jgi:DNA-binding SARP family transcriptional activator/Tfp pilus assembly protein PilF